MLALKVRFHRLQNMRKKEDKDRNDRKKREREIEIKGVAGTNIAHHSPLS